MSAGSEFFLQKGKNTFPIVFIYSKSSKVYTYANTSFVGVYNATEEDAVINLPACGVYLDLISGQEFICEGGELTLPKRDLRVYLLKRKEAV